MTPRSKLRAQAYVPPVTPFSAVVGEGLGRVVVYEDVARQGMTTLRWLVGGKNWRRKTLGRVVERDRSGEPTKAFSAWAKAEAMRKSLELQGMLPSQAAQAVAGAALTIGDTHAKLTAKKTGPYPHPSPYRAELLRALDFAAAVWGADRTWVSIRSEDWTTLIRTRLDALLADGKRAVRTTEITVVRLRTIVEWLRGEEHIPAGSAPLPAKWYEKLVTYWQGATGVKSEPDVAQPRHTVDQFRAMLAVAVETDPRVGLLMMVGAELRLGQVVRCTRTLLDLEAPPDGTLLVKGSGKKAGTVVELTRGQRVAVERALGPGGYLEDAERRYRAGEIADYALFPSGRMLGRAPEHRPRDPDATAPVRAYRHKTVRLSKDVDWATPMTSRAIRNGFLAIETAAGIDHEPGKGWYGIRRVNVDALLDPEIVGEQITEETLQAAGGWTSGDVPRAIYRDKEHKAGQRGARKARAAIRNEAPEDVHRMDTDTEAPRTPNGAHDAKGEAK